VLHSTGPCTVTVVLRSTVLLSMGPDCTVVVLACVCVEVLGRVIHRCFCEQIFAGVADTTFALQNPVCETSLRHCVNTAAAMSCSLVVLPVTSALLSGISL
jgi:hypothetical protein